MTASRATSAKMATMVIVNQFGVLTHCPTQATVTCIDSVNR